MRFGIRALAGRLKLLVSSRPQALRMFPIPPMPRRQRLLRSGESRIHRARDLGRADGFARPQPLVSGHPPMPGSTIQPARSAAFQGSNL
jgi:hypothetical protein